MRGTQGTTRKWDNNLKNGTTLPIAISETGQKRDKLSGKRDTTPIAISDKRDKRDKKNTTCPVASGESSTNRILSFFETHQDETSTTAQTSKILKIERGTARRLLNRLSCQGKLRRLDRGLFAFPTSPLVPEYFRNPNAPPPLSLHNVCIHIPMSTSARGTIPPLKTQENIIDTSLSGSIDIDTTEKILSYNVFSQFHQKGVTVHIAASHRPITPQTFVLFCHYLRARYSAYYDFERAELRKADINYDRILYRLMPCSTGRHEKMYAKYQTEDPEAPLITFYGWMRRELSNLAPHKNLMQIIRTIERKDSYNDPILLSDFFTVQPSLERTFSSPQAQKEEKEYLLKLIDYKVKYASGK